MFTKISSTVKYPHWVRLDPRYKKLDLYDRLLDGTFYDDLPYAFYDEQQQNGEPVPPEQRRPSAQYRLPRMVARWSARKLFAGRHAPRIWHKDKAVRRRVTKIAQAARLCEKMLEAVMLGSVGSVCVTFRITKVGDDPVGIVLSVWRAKYCYPTFTSDGDLDRLRICYLTSGANLKALDAPGVDVRETYWFIRDYDAEQEVTYAPVLKDDWNPIEGFSDEGRRLTPWPEEVYDHDLGKVPGQWFVNLSGGAAPDGTCTWEDAIPNSIEIDYTLSQIGRGTRYNCSPQPVIKGEIVNSDGTIDRGPTHYIHLAGDRKDADGNVLGGASASLLEMSGAGIKVALDLIHSLRNMALEQISASRKDPEKIKGQLSGRAMEFMEEDSDDLAMELRSQYGEHGMLPLLRKIVQAVDPQMDADGLALQWPRLNQPTPDEIAVLIPALALAIDPLGAAKQKIPAPKLNASDDAKPAQPSIPPEMPTPDPAFSLLTPEEARTYLKTLMDMAMLDLDEGDDDLDEDDTATGSESSAPAPEAVGEKSDIPPPEAFGA
jgi:hypothetical protein